MHVAAVAPASVAASRRARATPPRARPTPTAPIRTGTCRDRLWTSPRSSAPSIWWARLRPCRAFARFPVPKPTRGRCCPLYDFLFGERDPVAEPGTSTGTPGDWWTVFALVPDIFHHCVSGFGGLPQPGATARSAVARARPDARRVAGRQPVRVLAALQELPRARHAGGEDRGDRALGGCRLLRRRRAGVAGVHRLPRRPARPRTRRRVRRVAPPPHRRGDPRVHVHHRAVLHARGDDEGAAPRVGRPRRPDRRASLTRRLRSGRIRSRTD